VCSWGRSATRTAHDHDDEPKCAPTETPDSQPSQLEQLLLVPPVLAHQVGRDPEEPGPQRPAIGVVGHPAPVRGGEGLGRQVLGQVSANAPGDEPVNRREVLPEGRREVRRCPDRTGSQFLVHA
jgi:hypothetical protein